MIFFIFLSFSSFQCYKQKWHVLFFTCVNQVVCVLEYGLCNICTSNSEHLLSPNTSNFLHFSLYTSWVKYFGFPSKSKVLSPTGNNRFKKMVLIFYIKWNKIMSLFQKNFFCATDNVKIAPRLMQKFDFNNIWN